MLRSALCSVAAQTGGSHIGEVVVIENLSNRESGVICRDFPQLRIRYVFRDPPIPPGIESTLDAMKYLTGDYIAFLFDDDWWGEQHLEKSIESHTICPDVVASYGSCIWVNGEEGYLTGIHSSFIPWFAAEKPKIKGRWVFELNELLIAGLLKTAFHFSSLLIKRSVWEKCLDCIRDGNPYDTDRLMSVEMGKYGKVVMDSAPHVFIRAHESQECTRIGRTSVGQFWHNKSTEKLLLLAEKAGMHLQHEFSRRMSRKSVSIEDLIDNSTRDSFESLVEHGILRKPPMHRKVIHQILPPFLRSCLNSMRRKQVRIAG